MEKTQESIKRSLLKTLTWRVVILITDFFIAYLFTQDFALAGSFALVKMFVASAFYFLHERSWNLISWGKV